MICGSSVGLNEMDGVVDGAEEVGLDEIDGCKDGISVGAGLGCGLDVG